MKTGVKLVLVGLLLSFGCVRGYFVTPQVARQVVQNPQLPVVPTLKPVTSGQVKNCQVQLYDRVPCGEPGINATRCSAINCCFDGQQCYYGKSGKFGVLNDSQWW